MSSNIDPTKPTALIAYTADVRQNFSTAKTEIEALQAAIAAIPISVTGTVNRITVTAGVVDISANFVGQSSIITVGTITTGTWSGAVISAAKGGTGQTSYTTGDILYASGATAISRLAGVATGNVLISGGVATAPAWGKVDLTTHVTGVLPVANGGTGLAGPSGVVGTPRGRLTLTSGTCVTTADVTAATTLYYTPCTGATVPIYNGSVFVDTVFAELSQATSDNTKSPAAVAASKVYDIFVWNDTGTVRATRGPAWSSDTVRGTGAGTTELQQLSGIWTNKVAITNGPGANAGTYVGTVRSDGSSQLNDSATLRHVWNCYNRKQRKMLRHESTASWTYTTAVWRQANAAAANQLDFVLGLNEDSVHASALGISGNSLGGASTSTALGLDSTSTVSADSTMAVTNLASINSTVPLVAHYDGFPGIGRHYLTWLEYSVAVGTTTWYGTGSTAYIQSGIHGELMG